MNHLPKLILSPASMQPMDHAIHFAPILAEVSPLATSDVLSRMKTTLEGLSEDEAASRLADVGPNVVATSKRRGWTWRLLTAAQNPLVVLLIMLATISFATDDVDGGTVMTVMVILGVLLRFVQETRADAAADKLKAMINVAATVVRDGKEQEIPLRQLVPGDVVKLSAGDMIPADVRLVAARNLFITQGTLTGESLPVEKLDRPETRAGIAPLEFANVCFLGTSVESGVARCGSVVGAYVVATKASGARACLDRDSFTTVFERRQPCH